MATGVCEIPIGHSKIIDYKFLFVAYNFFHNYKEIISDNKIYRLQDSKVPNVPTLRAVNRAHGKVLEISFNALEAEGIKTLTIEKSVPPPLQEKMLKRPMIHL